MERKYRSESSPAVHAGFYAAANELVTALGAVRADGGGTDRALVTRTLVQHTNYVSAITRLFAAVDAGDTAAVQRIDRGEEEPAFVAIQRAVVGRAARQHSIALKHLGALQRLETLNRRLTPLVFVLGLLLAGLLALTSRGSRRLLLGERARAVHHSLHDALTGLPNRTLLAERIEQAVRAGRTAALLLIDIDRFKDINDTFGHRHGDQLLMQVGPRLAAGLRNRDTVARLGGDEFAVLLPDVADLDAAISIAEKLRQTLEATFHVEDLDADLDIEASVGVVLSGEHGSDPTTLLQHADIAMYVAKAQHDGVFAYNAELDGHSPAKLAVVGELRRALERGELVLHYQPKVVISSGEVTGVEALVRWQHPTRGMVYPDSFIPIAEHTGLIGPLSHYVLDAALSQVRAWADAGRPLRTSVNLSARNLLDDRLPDQVAALLAAHGVAASLLELEVTESAMMADPIQARRLLERLVSIGVTISIDDFGAGYTSLGQLTTMPVSELKIDRSFVMGMIDDEKDAIIVRSVTELGHNLGMTIVAEGVEDAATLTALAVLGCDIAQGYHIARPAAIDAFDLWCLGRRIASPHTEPQEPRR